MFDTRIRLHEMVALTLDDLDLDVHDLVHVLGKDSRARTVPFGSKAGTALDRYLRERAGHPHARPPALWIAQKGAMTDSGVAHMLRRRGVQAGVPELHPHPFRHTLAHLWKTAGGDGEDLMRLTGWRLEGDAGPLRRFGRRRTDHDTEHADAHTDWVRESWEAMRPHTTGDPYLNFLVDEGSERVRAAYGPEAFDRLVELKTRYDRGNVFSLNQNISPR